MFAECRYSPKEQRRINLLFCSSQAEIEDIVFKPTGSRGTKDMQMTESRAD